MNKIYEIKLGNQEVRFPLIYSGTSELFDDIHECRQCETADLTLDSQYLRKNSWIVSEDVSEEFLEFHCLMLACGNYILQYDHALFHGACFLWKGKAWIFTAPSGTGKTTQLKNWTKLWKNEVTVVNGDKPVIESRNDGSIWASSSPWKGKERIGKKCLNAPLGGIILLQQGKDNAMYRMDKKNTVVPLFCEFVSMPETTEQLFHQGNILNKILEVTPVWKLVNTGDKESAILTRKVLEEYLESAS